MIMKFMRCFYCSKVDDINKLIKRGVCVCGSRKLVETIATTREIVFFLLMHPSYLFKAIKEEIWKP